VKYKKFKISDIFFYYSNKTFPGYKRGKECVSSKQKIIPATKSSWSNNQLSSFAMRGSGTIFQNVISMTANGNGKAFYQPNDFSVLQDSYVLSVKKSLCSNASEKIYLYLITSLNKAIVRKYEFNNKPGWKRIKSDYIMLPITKENKLDFNYMEQYILELEKQYILKIDDYLKINGIFDYNLNDDDYGVLKKYNSCRKKIFKLSYLFEIKSNPSLNKDSLSFSKRGKYSYFTRTVFNNGINGYVNYFDDEHLCKGNCLVVGMMAMKFFYMKNNFYAGQFTKSIIPKFRLTEKLGQFFVSILNKYTIILLGILVRDFKKVFNEMLIELPITSSQQPNYELMEKYITVIQRKAVKDLVIWNREKLKIQK
jgi:hypothetical protein